MALTIPQIVRQFKAGRRGEERGRELPTPFPVSLFPPFPVPFPVFPFSRLFASWAKRHCSSRVVHYFNPILAELVFDLAETVPNAILDSGDDRMLTG